jgi:hypothetical protein
LAEAGFYFTHIEEWFFVWFEIPVDTITIKTSKYNSIVSTEISRLSINSRLSSYASWNSENAPTPTILAEAGFYFTHIEDKVACHMCGHGLRNWDIHDDVRTKFDIYVFIRTH